MSNAFNKSDNGLIIFFNGIAVLIAYGMLGLSLYMSPNVPLATKGYWGIGILLLTLALVNFVKLRFDERLADDRISRVEEARNERLLTEYVGGDDHCKSLCPTHHGITRKARKSFTFVSVGPVMICPLILAKNPWASFRSSAPSADTSIASARASVVGSAIAPATSAAPSTPSVSHAMT